MSDRPGNDEPTDLEPRHQPLADDILFAFACLISENDNLRARCSLPALNGRREYTRKDLERGRSLGPMAMIDSGDLIIKLES